jgi:hypothetical protein
LYLTTQIGLRGDAGAETAVKSGANACMAADILRDYVAFR